MEHKPELDETAELPEIAKLSPELKKQIALMRLVSGGFHPKEVVLTALDVSPRVL